MNLKKIFCTLILGSAFLLRGADDNLIPNPGLELSPATGAPAGWFLSRDAIGEVVDAPNGKKALRLVQSEADKVCYWRLILGRIEPGIVYELKGRIKADPGTLTRVYVECSGVWKTFALEWRKGTGQWQSFTLKDIRFEDVSKGQVYIVCALKNPGMADFTGLEFTEAPAVLRNGSFKSGLDNWEVTNGKITSRDGDGAKALELNSGNGPASARQSRIRIRKGRFYELRYAVRGGSDKTHRDPQNAVWFRAVPVMNGKILGSDAWQDSFDSWQRKTLAFQAPADGFIDILLEVKEPYCADFAGIELAEVKSSIPPLVLLADGPFAFRSGVYSSNRNVPKAKFTLINNTASEAASYLVRFNGAVTEIKGPGTVSFELDVPQAPGVYPVEATAKDASGKELAAVSLPFQVNPPAPREVTFREDRVMLIDGKPFFPLGVWPPGGRENISEKAKIVSECGFNLALANANTIDAYAEHGMMVLLDILTKLPKFQDEAHFARWDAQYRKAMEKHMRHPSLVGYFLDDEPAWRGVPVNGLLDAYGYVRKIDPYRPIMLNEAPRGAVSAIRPYSLACDTYGVDIYPVPEPNPHSGLDDKNMTSVGKYTDRCLEVVYGRKPVWMTLQGFAWGDLTKRPPVLPTLHQSRFMAYDAVVHGATGLFYWGFNHGADRWDFIRELGTLIRELRDISPVFVGETVNSDVFRTDSPAIRVLHKKADGKNWFIAVNESKQEVTADFRAGNTAPLRVFFEGRTVTPENGVIRETFHPYDVHVYSDAEVLPPPLTIPSTRRMTPKLDLPEDYRKASWIWFPGKSKVKDHRAFFKREFTLDSLPDKALVFATADDWFRMYINGRLFMEHYRSSGGWNNLSFRDAVPFLKTGKNTIFIKALDGGGAPCGMIYSATLDWKNGSSMKLLSDGETLASEDNENWTAAEIVCPFGGTPWGAMGEPKSADPEMLDAYGFPF